MTRANAKPRVTLGALTVAVVMMSFAGVGSVLPPAATANAASPTFGAGDPDPTFGTGGVVDIDAAAANDRWIDGVTDASGRLVGLADTGFSLAVTRQQAAGPLDTTFGSGGIARVDRLRPAGMALQSDGKMVVVASAAGPSGYDDVFVVRFGTDGQLDPTFGGDGQVTFDGGLGTDATDDASDVAVDSAGRIVVAFNTARQSDIAAGLARLLPDGSLDPAFGSAGLVIDRRPDSVQLGTIDIQSGDSVLLAGSALGGSGRDLWLARYRADGSADPAWGTLGEATYDAGGYEYAQDIVAVPGGDVILAHFVDQTGPDGAVAIKVSSTGVRDTTYGTSGRAIIRQRSGEEDIPGAVLAPGDGTVVVTGSTGELDDATSDTFVARLTSTGRLDLTFGTTGTTVVDLAPRGGRDGAAALTRLADGTLAAFGVSTTDSLLARFDSSGHLRDSTVLSLGQGGDDQAKDVAVTPGGSIVVAGDTGYGTVVDGSDLSVIRLDPSGHLDPTFGNGGRAIVDSGDELSDQTDTVALAPDGKIVIGGFRCVPGGCLTDGLIVRLSADGRLDSTFGTGGIATVDLGGEEQVEGVAVRANGSIVVAGTKKLANQPDTGFLVGLLASGARDQSFGTGGLVTEASVSYHDETMLPSGAILVAGTAEGSDPIARRFSGTGALDPLFGQAGKVRITTPDVDTGWCLAVDSDGRILLGGIKLAGVAYPEVVRLTANGQIDPTFSGDGIAIGAKGFWAHDIAVDGSHRPIAAGTDDSTAVTRFATAGDADPTFDGDGVRRDTPDPGLTTTISGLILDAAGRIITVGKSAGTLADRRGDLEIHRYIATGTQPAVSADDVRVNEGAGGAWVTIRLAEARPMTVSVGWSLEPGSANQDDYIAGGGSVVFPADTTTQTVGVTISDDHVSEATEAFTLRLSGPNGVSLPDDTAVITIDDNDSSSTPGTSAPPPTPGTTAPAPTPGTTAPPPGTPAPTTDSGPQPPPDSHGAGAHSGYWMLNQDGTVSSFGTAPALAWSPTPGPAVHIEPTPTGNGYWVLDSRGDMQARGDAPNLGGARFRTDEKAVSLSATPTGSGYWIFSDKGRVVTFGDARFHGDMSANRLNGPVLGSVATPSGGGYYMVASDGGIFTFGDAAFRGSTGNVKLNRPVMAMAPAPDSSGYWLVASDGGIFAFGVPFHGSMASTPLNKPISGLVPGRNGYLMVAQDGGIFSFGEVAFHGSLGAHPPASPVISVALQP
ncbi:MAG: hypothetical protein LC792_00130 [Actinobacteria bacterium]|nr:hypothetical protein [Actinomycetota bacterium]